MGIKSDKFTSDLTDLLNNEKFHLLLMIIIAAIIGGYLQTH